MEGLSKTTLAHARDILASQEWLFAGDPATTDFTDWVNVVLENFYERGGWRGSKATYQLTVNSNTVTLPYHLDSILMFRIDLDTSDDVAGPPGKIIGRESYEFLYNGPGDLDETKSTANAIVDAGEVATVVPFPSTASTLTVEISDSDDAAGAIRILGEDSSGNVIHDDDGAPGERVVYVSPTATTTNSFSKIYGIQKEATTQGRVEIKHGTTSLAVLQPAERHPVYRHYSVKHKDAERVTAFCKRRFVPVVNEEDYIIPGSIPALESGLRALAFDRNGEPDKAEPYWQKALRSLSGDKTQSTGGAMTMPQIDWWGRGVRGIRHIR